MAAAGPSGGLADIARDYLDLVTDGIAIWPAVTYPKPLVASWERALVGAAKADRLRAALHWYHVDDVAYHPCVTLLRPDGSSYSYDGDNTWPRTAQPPPRAPAAAGLRPLVEADWSETLEHARAKAGGVPLGTDAAIP